ncbi:MAG: hypothetical protein H7Y38_03680 [Armatimonadetes bacterium]|nr:hypothetical protein [Armatimonadota bacterium]
MSEQEVLNILLPCAFGAVGVLVMAWVYILHDHGTWRRFWRHKERARVFYSAQLAFFLYALGATLIYKAATYQAPDANHPPMRLPLRFATDFAIAVLATPILYGISDQLVQKYGKIGDRRPHVGNVGTRDYAAGWGGEHHI